MYPSPRDKQPKNRLASVGLTAAFGRNQSGRARLPPSPIGNAVKHFETINPVVFGVL
jgi:hypothetical protein